MPARPVYLQTGLVLHWNLLVQIAVCVLPASAAIALAHPQAAGWWIHFAVLVLLARHLLKEDRFAFSTVIVGCIPTLMLLREYFYFHGFTVMLAAGLLLWLVKAPREVRSPPVIVCLVFAVLYWGISFWFTGVYSANLRVLELVFSAANVCLLGKQRSFVSTALLGIWFSMVSTGASLLPYGERVGRAVIANIHLGNPITLGIPACLIFLLSVADRGRWLLLQDRPWLRLVVNITAVLFLLLSTARGSWLIALVGLVPILVLGRRKLSVVLWLVVTGLVIIGVVYSERGPVVTHYFFKATSSDNSFSQRTTGRSRQWATFPEIFSDAPIWGHGPGSGVATNYQYTGSSLEWHSLYLQTGVETGIVGLAILATFAAWVLWRGFSHWRFVGEVVPLVSIVGFLGIGISVTGLDAVSGLFLGLSFLGRDFSHMAVISAAPRHAPTLTGLRGSGRRHITCAS